MVSNSYLCMLIVLLVQSFRHSSVKSFSTFELNRASMSSGYRPFYFMLLSILIVHPSLCSIWAKKIFLALPSVVAKLL